MLQGHWHGAWLLFIMQGNTTDDGNVRVVVVLARASKRLPDAKFTRAATRHDLR